MKSRSVLFYRRAVERKMPACSRSCGCLDDNEISFTLHSRGDRQAVLGGGI